MPEKFFELQLPLDGAPADLDELAAVVEIKRVVQNIPHPRHDEFDTRYRSDSLFVEVVTWVTSGAAIASIIPLKSVLTTYLQHRNKEISITIDGNNLTMKGPLTQKQINETIDKFVQLNGD